LDGPLVADHRLPLSELTRISDRLRVALRDVAIVLSDIGPSGRGGRVNKAIEQSTDLRVVASPQPGSFCLELETPSSAPAAQEPLAVDFGPHLAERAIETFLTGLEALDDEGHLPTGFDRGVLRAITAFQTALRNGITSIDLHVANGDGGPAAQINAEKVRTARRLTRRPIRAHAVAEGVLQMVDFTRLECRVDRPPLPSVVCFFEERDRDRVQELVRQFVRVVGEGEYPPGEDQPSKISAGRIDLLYETLGFDRELFWESPRLDDLAERRHAHRYDVHAQDEGDLWRDDDEAAALIAAIHRRD
jgi:hypothetical protein